MNAPDAFSRIAIATEPGSYAGSASLEGEWNRDPSWLWPPPTCQAYCRLHFLKECSLYHLEENVDFKHAVKTSTSRAKSSKWPAAPTRVQPARRAREKKLNDGQGTGTSRTSSPARGSKAEDPGKSLEARLEQLQLHLAWPVYKTQLEGHINQISNRPPRESQLSTGSRFDSGYFLHELGFQCRYCNFDFEVMDCDGSVRRKLAPPAPMHDIQPDDLMEGQVGGFGGLKFAVDICGDQEMVVLLGMEKLKDPAFEAVKGKKSNQLRGRSQERYASTRNTGGPVSRKRTSTTSFVEMDESFGRVRRRKMEDGRPVR
ncbi:hypothetical protein GGR54DRAFT_202261 [Hypoxylon sp. NC1633]|nr:hypothetical protein GGR54DRAFT_202261 [Hypoxylon sp. NC1633]